MLRGRLRPLGAVWLAALALPATSGAEAGSTPKMLVQKRTGAVSDARVFRFERPVAHVAVHWRGARSAHVDVAFSRDGRRFGALRHVGLDEVGRNARDGETYGEVMVAPGVRAVRAVTDRRLRRLTVVGFTDRDASRSRAQASTHVETSPVISRSGWGADESLRFDRRKREIWPPEYWDVQKLIVHHTAGENDDPDPAATIRAIYRYHAVNQGWGDIGYNFLVDEAGRVYEGRYSGPAGDLDPPVDATPGEDAERNGVTAGHAYGYNAGTVGVALLGTLSSEQAAAAARTTLEEFLAWGAERHSLDPLAAGTYTNPVTGQSTHLPNVLAHRDVAATECPGEVVYGSLQQLREATALRLEHGSSARFALQASPDELKIVRGRSAQLTITAESLGDLDSTITLAADGLPGSARVAFSDTALASGESATVTVSTAKNTPTGAYLLRVEGTSSDTLSGLADTRAAAVRVSIVRR